MFKIICKNCTIRISQDVFRIFIGSNIIKNSSIIDFINMVIPNKGKEERARKIFVLGVDPIELPGIHNKKFDALDSV